MNKSDNQEDIECFNIEKLNEDAKQSFYYLKDDLNNFKLRVIYHKKEARHLIPYLITFYPEPEVKEKALMYSKQLKKEIESLEKNMNYELSYDDLQILDKFIQDVLYNESEIENINNLIKNENQFKIDNILHNFDRDNNMRIKEKESVKKKKKKKRFKF